MYIIKSGTVHIGNGQVLENTDILVNKGKIVKVEKNIECSEAEVIDAAGKEVFPGFIDPISSIGCTGSPTSYVDNAEKSSPIVPEMDITYSIDPDEVTRQEFYKTGITSVGLTPNNTCIIGGQIAVFKTAQDKFSNRLLRKKVAMKCSVTSAPKGYYGRKNTLPMTKMGIFGMINEAREKLNHTEEKDYSTRDKELKKLFDDKINPIIAAETKAEIDAAIEVFGKTNKNITISDAFEFDRSLDKVLENKVNLIIGNICELSQVTKHDMKLEKLQDLINNGNKIALTTSCGGSSEGREVILWTAIDIYRAGIDAEEVIKMLTSSPAQILGVDDRIGSIEEGKDADIVVYSAHPIKTYNAHVEKVLINGEVVL